MQDWLEAWRVPAAIYLAGAAVTALLARDRLRVRLGLALAWPLGPLAFVVTVTLLLAALPLFSPLAGVVVWAMIGMAIAAAWRAL